MTTASGHNSAIAASRVIGTAVYNMAGERIGRIEDIMLDKMSSGILFAVLGFGSFLGIGEKFHAVPWSALDYDEAKGGYVVPFSRQQLEAAPAHSIEELRSGGAKAARDESYDYYKIDPYWS